MVKFSETCSFLCRHWMSCLWKLKQLRRVTVWVLIRQGCQRSTDCQHHQCILRVLQIPTQLLLKIQSPESPRTQGSFSHRFILIQILMELDAFTRQVFIQRLICKTSECAYWSEFFFFFATLLRRYIHLIALSNFGDGWNSTCQGWLIGKSAFSSNYFVEARYWYCFHLYMLLFCSSNIV